LRTDMGLALLSITHNERGEVAAIFADGVPG
jgi:hypothetical protein